MIRLFVQKDSVEIDMTVAGAIDVVQNKVMTWLETAVSMIPNFIVALLIIFAFFLIGRLVRSGIKRLGTKINSNKAIVDLLSATMYILIIGLGLFVSLSVLQLDKTVTSLLAGAGIIGIALGFAFQDTVANFLAGILIAFRKPYKINDIVYAQDYMGVVDRINLRSTVIRTFQGQEVLIPNKQIFNNPIVNYTNTGKRRIDLEVGISYGDNLKKVKEVTLNALKDADFVLEGSDVRVDFTEFGDSSINFTVRLWVDYPDEPDFLEARSQMVMRIKKAYDENDITIPFPIRTLDFGIKGGKKLSETVISIDQMNGSNKEKQKE